MRTMPHLLTAMSSGTARELISLHFGQSKNNKKVYIQSSLHADEIPGMLVIQYLREYLLKLESEHAIEGEIVLIPIANPIGLDQEIHGVAFGRFDLASGINFNRAYLHLTPQLISIVEPELSQDAEHNIDKIRHHAKQILQQWSPKTESGHLKKSYKRFQLMLISCSIYIATIRL